MSNNVISFDAHVNVRLHVFSGKLGPHADSHTLGLYNQVYNFWESFWEKVMAGIQSALPSTEEFFRQDKILALIDERNPAEPAVVAFLCLNQYNLLSSAKKHSYLTQYSSEFWGEMHKANVSSVWSGQFITVSDSYSARATRVNFAAVILGLLHTYYANLAHSNSALISLARSDIASANTAKKFGWQTVGEPIVMHNVPVQPIALVGAPGPHRDAEVNTLIDKLWNRRTEHESGNEKAGVTYANVA
jgi:hypothetical protein